MANQTAVQISPVKETEDIDECRENVPPGVIAFPGTSKLKDQDRDVIGCSSAHQNLENDPHSLSTPAPTTGNPKMGHSRFQSALTPILKQLNIHKRHSSPPTRGNSSHLTAPSLSYDSVANSQNVSGPNQPSNKDITSSLSRQTFGDVNAPVCWLADECLPEITFLDATCDTTLQLSKNDTTLPDSLPSTPARAGLMCTFNTPKPLVNNKPDVNSMNMKPLCKQSGAEALSATSSNNHQTSQHQHLSTVVHAKQDHSHIAEASKGEMMAAEGSMMVDVPESVDAPLRWLDDRYFPEITLLEVTHHSDFSPKGNTPQLELTQDGCGDLPNNLGSSALGGKAEADPGTRDTTRSEDLSRTLDASLKDASSSVSEKLDNSIGKNTPKVSFEGTRDISMESGLEDSRPSLESSGQSTAKIQRSVEETPGGHPVNVTRDINSFSDASVHCTSSHTQCNTSSQNATSEARCDQGSINVTDNRQEPPAGQLTSKSSEQNPKPSGSVNGTFTIVPQSNQKACAPANTTAEILGPQNKTLDLPTSDGTNPKAQKDADNQPTATESKKNNESSIQNLSSDMQNATFEKLQKSTGGMTSVEAASVSSQSNTFTMKSPKDNGTITISEISSSDSQHSSLDKPSPQKSCHPVKSPEQGRTEALPPETAKQYETTGTHSDPNMAKVHEAESNPAAEAGSAQLDTKDHSHSGLPLKDGFPDTSGQHSLDADENKSSTFNLDDTLDLRADSLITSTPMVTCKMFNFSTEREEDKAMAVQKKLYGEGPSEPAHQVHSEVPSNIVCDRKTFLTKTAAKSVLPPLKTASQLLRYKPASALPGRPEPPVSGLPVTRQKAQAATLRNTDPSLVPTGKPVPYLLRPTTTGSKQSTGLPILRSYGVPTGIQRAAQGLKPPVTRSNTAASSSTDKLRGPTVTNPASKTSQAKKHSLPRGEPLPMAKRKKMDASLQSEASAASGDTSNRVKTLKPPTAAPKVLPEKAHRADAAEALSSCIAVSKGRALKQPVTTHKAVLPKPQTQSCVKCAALQQQLDVQSEEIRRLKEELMKYSQPHEEC